MTTDLDELLRQVARQDVDAFATFYDQTRARVFGLVTRVLRDPGYSEETTPGHLPAGVAYRRRLQPRGGSPLAWLMTFAHRRAVDRGCAPSRRPPNASRIRRRERRAAVGPGGRFGDSNT